MDLEDFTPNAGPPKFEWATYIPGRRPLFKAHREIGHAKNAFHGRSQAILYKWDPSTSKWLTMVTHDGVKNKAPYCQECGQDFESYIHTAWKGMQYMQVCRSCSWKIKKG